MRGTRTADGTVPSGWPVEVVDDVVAQRVNRLERRMLWPAWIAAGAAVLVLGFVVWIVVEVRHANRVLGTPYSRTNQAKEE